MTQTTLDFSGSFPRNPFTKGTQNHEVYEWISYHGSVTTGELHNVLHVDTARLRTDIKPYLRQHGYEIECQSIPGVSGNRLYVVRG